VCRHDQTQLDALGRLTKQILVNDPDGQTTVATTYDSGERIATRSNPYRTTSDPTYGLEIPAYDGLGRIIQSTHPDADVSRVYYGAAVSTGGGTSTRNCSAATYGLGYPILSVDEVGRKRQTWTDGFGRVIETDEPNAAGSLAVGSCFTYDPNNNLTAVANTSTSQTRSYSYDLLPRVTAATTPESGTTNFYYTTTIGGATLCSGDPSAVCLRKDSRNITTTFVYDALNRVTAKTYSDSTAPASYFYDQTSYNGLTITNGKGRRTGMSDGSGQTAWTYNSVGNVLSEKRTIKGVTKTLSYTYDPDSSVATITYPSGRIIAYTQSNAQRTTDAKDVANAKNYATSATYTPPGGLSSVLHGYVSGGFSGVNESYAYNNRLQLTSILATSSAGTAVNLTYSYAQSGHNNSSITTQTNGISSGRTQTYGYDPLNRLLSAQSAATSGAECWGLTFGNNATPPTLATDALNNFTNMNQTKCNPPLLNVGVNNNNQIYSPTGYSYDAAGNSTADGAYTYAYDAENHTLSASNVPGGPYCYTYDGDGLRVAKAHGATCASPTVDTLYWRSFSGDTIATTGASGSTTDSSYHEFIFFAGRRIARSDGASPGNVYYLFVDHLGSTRAMTQSNGVVCFASDYYPYGQELNFLNTCPLSYKFTGYERDTETGLDYAFARYYNPRIGRFMSGDPLGGAVSDPQSLNRYSYVLGNPANLTDPSGMLPAIDDWGFRDWYAPRNGLGRRNPFKLFTDVIATSAYFNGGNPFCTSSAGSVVCPWNMGEGVTFLTVQEKATAQPCIPTDQLNWLQKAQLKAARTYSRITGGTVGFGVGVDAGAGIGPRGSKWNVGGGGSASTLIVADASGNAGFLNSASGGLAGVKTSSSGSWWGAGAAAGPTVLLSPFPINKIAGPSWSVSGGGGAVLGAGGSATSSGAVTLTFGVGAGSEAGVSPQYGTSQFVPFCHE
jgi:RHS repeat-associated protein